MDLIIEDMMAKLQKSETFGGRLTEAREEAEWWDGSGIGYTQGELADLLKERCGVEIGRSYISELERSWQQNKMPSLEVAAALAQTLKVNLNWLAGLSTNKEPEDADADLAWSPTTSALSNIVDDWPETARQMLLAAVRAMNSYIVEDTQVSPADTGAAGVSEQERLNRLLNSNGAAYQGDNQPKTEAKRKSRR